MLCAVVTDRFDRATFHRFLAKAFFLGRLGLLVNERMTAVIVAFEIGGRGFTAKIAVDALLIDVELSGGVFGIFVRGVGHNFAREREVRWKRPRCKSKPERPAWIAGEAKPAQRRRKIDIFRQGKHLEAAAEHFRME